MPKASRFAYRTQMACCWSVRDLGLPLVSVMPTQPERTENFDKGEQT
jgi:hypothetical protein